MSGFYQCDAWLPKGSLQATGGGGTACPVCKGAQIETRGELERPCPECRPCLSRSHANRATVSLSQPADGIVMLPPLDGDWRDSVVLLKSSPVYVPRRTLERCRDLAERVLAFTGENPDRDLVALQHELVVLLQPRPAPTAPAPSPSNHT